MKRLLMVSTTVAAAGVLAAWSPALAQDSGDTRVRVGLGAQLRPEFIGADTPKWPTVGPRHRPRHGRVRLQAPDYSFGIPLISSGGFSFGPAEISPRAKEIGPRRARREGRQRSRRARLRTIRSAIVVPSGGGLKGLGGHKGVVGTSEQIKSGGTATATCSQPDRGCSVRIRYERAYFEVTPAAALAPASPPIGRAGASTVSQPRAAFLTSSATLWGCSDTGAARGWSAMPASRPSFGSSGHAIKCRAASG